MLTNSFSTIAYFGHEFILWILVALSTVSLAFIIEKWLFFRGLSKENSTVLSKIAVCMENNKLEEVKDLGSSTGLGKIISCGLKHVESYGSKGLEEIFESYEISKQRILDKRLNFLATTGANAPFIGLLGTVFGIMESFRALAQNTGDSSLIMIGISQALVATAVGLLVAIPAVVAYNYFKRKVRTEIQALEVARNLCLAFAKTRSRG